VADETWGKKFSSARESLLLLAARVVSDRRQLPANQARAVAAPRMRPKCHETWSPSFILFLMCVSVGPANVRPVPEPGEFVRFYRPDLAASFRA